MAGAKRSDAPESWASGAPPTQAALRCPFAPATLHMFSPGIAQGHLGARPFDRRHLANGPGLLKNAALRGASEMSCPYCKGKKCIGKCKKDKKKRKKNKKKK